MHLPKFLKAKNYKNSNFCHNFISFLHFFEKKTFKHVKVLLKVFSISEKNIKPAISKYLKIIKLSFYTT
jgi:hypothetical protein